ncbi:MAG: hypothetical protein R6U64_09725 [Bacteroidales bacterium]
MAKTYVTRTFFTLDNGPAAPTAHEVTPGVDQVYMPNRDVEYEREPHHE